MSHLIRADLPEPSPPTTKRLTTSSPRVRICSSGFCHISHLVIWFWSYFASGHLGCSQISTSPHRPSYSSPTPSTSDEQKPRSRSSKCFQATILPCWPLPYLPCVVTLVWLRDREGKAHIHPHTQTQNEGSTLEETGAYSLEGKLRIPKLTKSR